MTRKASTSDPTRSRGSVEPQSILVLGMHRSGTSALTRVLNLLGCFLPDDLIGAGDGNERGHWESVAVVALNDAILDSAGSSWEDWGPINRDWRDSRTRTDMLDKVVREVENHATVGPLFAMKDPRLCRLADLWLEGMDAAGVNALVVMMLRNPAEVVASLEHRDLMAPGYGQLLWLRHVLDAEYFSRGRTRVICHYEDLMRNWFDVVNLIKSELGVVLPRNSAAAHAEIEDFLNNGLRHHHEDAIAVVDNPGFSVWLRRIYSIFLQWSESGESKADYAEIDTIRQQFDHAYHAFARLLLSCGATGAAGSGSHLKKELSAQLAIAQSAAEAAKMSVAEAEKDRAAAEREAELKVSLAHASHELELRNAELAGQVSALQSALVQRQDELAQLLAQFHEAERKRTLAKQQVDVLTSEVARMTTLLQEQEKATEQAAKGASDSAAEAVRLAEKVQHLTDAVKIADATHRDVERKLADRFTELAQLTAIVAEEAGRADAAQSDAQWLRDVRRLEERFPTWWAIMPQAWRQRRAHRRYYRAGLFDADAYVTLYPDVAAEAMDPVRHYILHGLAEGRTRPVPA